MKDTKPSKNLFDNTHDGDLGKIIQAVKSLKSLSESLKQYLPGKLGEHCMVANLSKGKLMITLDSNAWAGKFYYEKPNLLSQLRQTPEFAGITHIEHKVDPDLFKSLLNEKPKPIPKPHLSHDASDALSTLIGQTDGELKAKLEQLKSRFER